MERNTSVSNDTTVTAAQVNVTRGGVQRTRQSNVTALPGCEQGGCSRNTRHIRGCSRNTRGVQETQETQGGVQEIQETHWGVQETQGGVQETQEIQGGVQETQ